MGFETSYCASLLASRMICVDEDWVKASKRRSCHRFDNLNVAVQLNVVFVLFQRLKDALGEVVAEMQSMDTADEG